ncbi:MAG TPA: FlgT C-terminal domain-containing protein [Methylomirabilota bacterium]|nr:FlgT C-terminal domain-containing protein [Methylomirabilota bacterium]
MTTRYLAWLLLAAVALSGCSTMKMILGVRDPGEPSVIIKSAETRWLLIKNPRFGDVASEPEYVWVEEDKVPTTITTLLRGKSAIIAPPEIVAKYGTPPGGGKISPRQGTMYQTAEPPRPAAAAAAAPRGSAGAAAGPAGRTASTAPTAIPVPAPKPPERGYVVYVDSARIVIDLTNIDGLRTGSVLSLRRDRIPIVHPVTGELLGELDEEVATARVTEIRDRFSVAEVQSVAPGAHVQVRDRVVLK